MDRSDKAAWLEGPGDLKEADVEDVPVPGKSVRVRGLPAQYSNQAQSEALEQRIVGKDVVNVVNVARLEVLQFTHGVTDPEFTEQEALKVAERYGPAFRKVIDKIDELSAIDKEAIEEANARFQGGGASANGADVGAGDTGGDRDPRPAVPARAGARAEDAGGGAR